jgi:hypothetical protein
VEARLKVVRPKLSIVTIGNVMRAKRRAGEFDGMREADITWVHAQMQAVLDGRDAQIGPFEGVDDAWYGEPCFVVGGSRGLKTAMDAGFKLKMLDGFHSIGVNHVVEDYHDFEWFMFMDPRFLAIAKYDVLKDYKGRVFTSRRASLKPSEHVTVFYTQSNGPSLRLIDGLLGFTLTGIVAINLALISGARPIYLLGLDNGGFKDPNKHTHYKDTYTGERLGQGNYKSRFFDRVPERLLKYAPWADRFVNVDKLGSVTVFPKMGVRDIPELKDKFA